MKPVERFTPAEIPADLYFVRKPERSQGRVTIPAEIVRLLGIKTGDIIIVSARNPVTDATVAFTSALTLGNGTFTMPKSVREAIGVVPGEDGEYQNVEFRLKALHRAPDGYQLFGRPRTKIVDTY